MRLTMHHVMATLREKSLDLGVNETRLKIYHVMEPRSENPKREELVAELVIGNIDDMA